MKTVFEVPEMEIVYFSIEDVLTTSGQPGVGTPEDNDGF